MPHRRSKEAQERRRLKRLIKKALRARIRLESYKCRIHKETVSRSDEDTQLSFALNTFPEAREMMKPSWTFDVELGLVLENTRGTGAWQ